MPKETKYTCDICGNEIPSSKKEIFTYGEATKRTIKYEITIPLIVKREGPVPSHSEPVGDLCDDYICLNCIKLIINDDLLRKKQ